MFNNNHTLQILSAFNFFASRFKSLSNRVQVEWKANCATFVLGGSFWEYLTSASARWVKLYTWTDTTGLVIDLEKRLYCYHNLIVVISCLNDAKHLFYLFDFRGRISILYNIFRRQSDGTLGLHCPVMSCNLAFSEPWRSSSSELEVWELGVDFPWQQLKRMQTEWIIGVTSTEKLRVRPLNFFFLWTLWNVNPGSNHIHVEYLISEKFKGVCLIT